MKRPQTPHIDIISSNEEQNEKEQILRNFPNFMKQVIDNQNETFLTGEKNIVKDLLAKYLQVPYEDLDTMKKISIRINNDYGLLNQFGQFLPELILLKLNFSNIITMNNLGTSFTGLMCLQMNNCFINDLSGIICLQNLRVLDLKNNEISDLIELEMCNLQKINLNTNFIADYDNLTFLSNMEELDWLNLDNNPISKKDDYKEKLQNYLSNVSDIDLDEDIVSMFDNGHIKINKRKIEERGYGHAKNKADMQLVQDINKVLGNDDDDEEEDKIIGKQTVTKEEVEELNNNNKPKEQSSSIAKITSDFKKLEYNVEPIQLSPKHLEYTIPPHIMSQSQIQFINKGIEHDLEEEKNKGNDINQMNRSNVFRTKTTKYQIDANGSCQCRNSQLKQPDNNHDLNNVIKPQIKRGSSLNPIRSSRIERERIAITAKPLLQSINTHNTNTNNLNLLKESSRTQVTPVKMTKSKLFLNKK